MKDSLKKFMNKFPVFLTRDPNSNFYGVCEIWNNEFKNIRQELFHVYVSSKLFCPLLIHTEQESVGVRRVFFDVSVPHIKEVNILKNGVLIYSEVFNYDDLVDSFNYIEDVTSESIVPDDEYTLNVISYDELEFSKTYPEKTGEHDQHLDEIGKLLNVPRKTYTIPDDDDLLVFTEPAYYIYNEECDYYYLQRLKFYTSHLHDTPLPVLEVWKYYNVLGTLTNFSDYLCKMDIDYMCAGVESSNRLLIVTCNNYNPHVNDDFSFKFLVYDEQVNTVSDGVIFAYCDDNVLLDDNDQPVIIDGKFTDNKVETGVLEYRFKWFTDYETGLSELKNNNYCFVETGCYSNSFIITVKPVTDVDWYIGEQLGYDGDGRTPDTPFENYNTAFNSIGFNDNLGVISVDTYLYDDTIVPTSCTITGLGEYNNGKYTEEDNIIYFDWNLTVNTDVTLQLRKIKIKHNNKIINYDNVNIINHGDPIKLSFKEE